MLFPLPQVADAIRRNVLLGSSGIGIAAAYGLACGARKLEDIGFEEEWNRMCANMAATRPTAPDLFRCIEAMKREVSEHRGTHPALLEALTMRADELQSARMALDSAISDQADRFIKSGVRPPASLAHCSRSARACTQHPHASVAGQDSAAREHWCACHGWIRRVAGRDQVCQGERQGGFNRHC